MRSDFRHTQNLSAVAFQGLTLSAQSIEKAEYEEHVAHLGELVKAVSLIRLVGSPEVFARAKQVSEVLSEMVIRLYATKRGERPRSLAVW
jgi:hypothetical protein